jgi:FkbM family methyltransferase
MFTQFSLLFLTFIVIVIVHGNKNNLYEDLVLVNTSGVSFFSGPMQGWTMGREQHVIEVIEKVVKLQTISIGHNQCLFVDVGMNDGFYTNLALALGCKVFSFELQRKCIQIATSAFYKNNVSPYVTIINRPVSSAHNKQVKIPINTASCDGLFSTDQADKCPGNPGGCSQKLSPQKYVNATFSTIALDSFFPGSTMIDFIKIDTGTLRSVNDEQNSFL